MQKCSVCIVLVIIYTGVAAQTDNTLVTFSTTDVPAIEEIFISDDKSYTWTSIGFPQPYPAQDQNLIIKTSEGYSILITIEKLDLDGDSGDFLVIKPGITLEGEGEGKVFTYHLKSTRKYLIASNNVYISLQIRGNNDIGKQGFSFYYKRIGEEFISSTENPTTAVTWPTPSGSESAYYTVNVSGKTPEDFSNKQTLLNLKSAFAEMAIEYCDTNNVLLSDKITEQNVQIYYLVRCPYAWPNSDVCVKVRFALPVLLQDNSVWKGYQLNTDHLEQMWVRLGGKYLTKYEMDVYSVPDNRSTFVKWIVICVVTLILFLILLGVIKTFRRQFSASNNQKRRLSDVGGFMSTGSRVSKVSLAPHPYQSTPSFFENDYSYDQWEPNVAIPEKSYASSLGKDYAFPLSEDESDNEIIFDNFSNSRNNIEPVTNESNS